MYRPINHGYIEVVIGPMYSGKSEELIRRLKRAKIAKQNVIVFKPGIDDRYSKDDVVFEEFKGTGNMELHLDRKLAEKRVYPAVDIYKSGTRREDLLLTEEEKYALWKLRKEMSNNSVYEVTDKVLELLKRTKDNSTFVKYVKETLN